MTYEDTVFIKIDKQTKQKMKKIKVNWSAVIRESIKAEIYRQKNLAKAVAIMDKIFSGQKKSRYDSTAVIRYWRGHRYDSR